MINYVSNACTRSQRKIKVELDLSNNTEKSDLKYATHYDASKFAKGRELANLKSDIDK